LIEGARLVEDVMKARLVLDSFSILEIQFVHFFLDSIFDVMACDAVPVGQSEILDFVKWFVKVRYLEAIESGKDCIWFMEVIVN
jgi:hypothetical protein